MQEKNIKNGISRVRLFCGVLALILFLNMFNEWNVIAVYANNNPKILTVSQAKKLALSNSKKYKTIKSDITLLNVKYEQAVKSIALKKHNMSTFRWTPLLSFKFPEKANLAEEYEFTYKPLQIQSDIKAKKHELSDIVYEIYEETDLLFINLYVCQEKINFNNQRIENLKKDIKRNQVRLLTGEATQEDLDKMQSSLSKLEMETATQMRSFETSKQDLSNIIKMDVSTGYQFSNPLVSANIERSQVTSLIERTLEMNQEYYEAKLNSSLTLTSLNTYESLMKNQYGKNMGYIQSYVNMAKKNQDIDYDAFKSSYEAMQKKVDEPWTGKKRILFIKIPKEWFKGQISGIRYIEDEPYALISAAKEYTAAINEQDSIRKSKEKEVKTGFENIVTAKNAYLALKENVNTLKGDYQKALAKNKLGEVLYEDVKSAQDEYEDAQMDMMDSLAAYTELLCSYDRLTCGGITALLSGENINGESGAGGDSIVIDEGDEGAYYTIQSKVEDNLFLFSVSIPEDFEPAVTHYELWVNGIQIGERTDTNAFIRHLALDLENVDSAFVRFYSDNEFIDDCNIDVSVFHDKLNIKNGYVIKPQLEIQAGTYKCKDMGNGMVEVEIQMKLTEVAYYCLVTTEGKTIFSEILIPVSDSFRYLSVLQDSFTNMKIYLYGKDEQLLYEGEFHTETRSIQIRERG